jgi:methylated-DNA-[protein]-cysteine S-methyltransferase
MWTVMPSPVGDLRIVEHGGAITAIEFSPFRDHDGRPRGDRDDAHPVLVECVRQLRAYFDRDLKEFELPLAPQGSDFQKSVWAQLLEIGYGDTASYGDIAKRLASPTPPRARWAWPTAATRSRSSSRAIG